MGLINHKQLKCEINDVKEHLLNSTCIGPRTYYIQKVKLIILCMYVRIISSMDNGIVCIVIGYMGIALILISHRDRSSQNVVYFIDIICIFLEMTFLNNFCCNEIWVSIQLFKYLKQHNDINNNTNPFDDKTFLLNNIQKPLLFDIIFIFQIPSFAWYVLDILRICYFSDTFIIKLLKVFVLICMFLFREMMLKIDKKTIGFYNLLKQLPSGEGDVGVSPTEELPKSVELPEWNLRHSSDEIPEASFFESDSESNSESEAESYSQSESNNVYNSTLESPPQEQLLLLDLDFQLKDLNKKPLNIKNEMKKIIQRSKWEALRNEDTRKCWVLYLKPDILRSSILLYADKVEIGNGNDSSGKNNTNNKPQQLNTENNLNNTHDLKYIISWINKTRTIARLFTTETSHSQRSAQSTPRFAAIQHPADISIGSRKSNTHTHYRSWLRGNTLQSQITIKITFVPNSSIRTPYTIFVSCLQIFHVSIVVCIQCLITLSLIYPFLQYYTLIESLLKKTFIEYCSPFILNSILYTCIQELCGQRAARFNWHRDNHHRNQNKSSNTINLKIHRMYIRMWSLRFLCIVYFSVSKLVG